MGIVVTVFMLLGLLKLSSLSFLGGNRLNNHLPLNMVISHGLLLVGLWNTAWFGLQHLTIFWGVAALLSGLLMMLCAIIIIVEHPCGKLSKNPLTNTLYRVIKPFKCWLIAALWVSFLLYATTLVQLNLGLAIIQ